MVVRLQRPMGLGLRVWGNGFIQAIFRCLIIWCPRDIRLECLRGTFEGCHISWSSGQRERQVTCFQSKRRMSGLWGRGGGGGAGRGRRGRGERGGAGIYWCLGWEAVEQQISRPYLLHTCLLFSLPRAGGSM